MDTAVNVEAATVSVEDTPIDLEAQTLCVDARNYEKFRLAKKILGLDMRKFGSVPARNRIESYPFSGHGDDIVRQLAADLYAASAEPKECGDFKDHLERLEKARNLKEIKNLYEGQFKLIEALSIDPPEPANNDDRKKIVGYNSIAAHIKLSVFELGIDKNPGLLKQAEDHFNKALKCLLEWKGERPKLWKVRRLKMVTNLAVIKQHMADLDGKGLEELKADLEELCNRYHLIEDLVWYSEIVPRVHHYYINAVELCSILNDKDRWLAAMERLSAKVDNYKFRGGFIGQCYGMPASELPTFMNHFEWLADYNQRKTKVRTSS
ncbi:hypothetical protein HFO07_26715 [Rhizobium leguminosarum]|uniref:hypothetical protein n=1 Tax=Rhizobium leguminosarum TaxID=384 RepID=UPI001C960B76|nr:hypothetical protein [Rhizobium leguminosarum]MBY5760207.1 hypothetical protein [Rhizobium leguminosarum]